MSKTHKIRTLLYSLIEKIQNEEITTNEIQRELKKIFRLTGGTEEDLLKLENYKLFQE